MLRRPTLRRPTLRALAGAVLLGVGAIFQPKPRPDDHWSTRPKLELVAESPDVSPGARQARGRHRHHRRPPQGRTLHRASNDPT